LAAKDDGQLLGLTQGTVQVQQAIKQPLQRRLFVEDEVVAVLDLGDKQAMAISLLPLLGTDAG
jgi:hypothetical protein